MTTAKYKNAITAAGPDAAKLMTAQMRKEATDSGWPSNIVNAISVKYTNNGFDFNVPKKYQESVDNLQYGNSTNQPNRVFHRVANRTEEVETFLIQNAYKRLGGKL
jgi:hypothetical protein